MPKRFLSPWLLGLLLASLVGGAATAAGPGTCTAERHRALQDAVDAACKIPRRCDGTQDCATLQSNADKNLVCAAARDAINVECFGGGDPGHRQAADDARRAAQRCTIILATKKCKDCP
jgi:type VI secretion system secreted protein VgrG